ncbi:hypothetical protein ACNJ69_12245 [Acinetobacter soli]|uniref:hypothetical protein n=1 Tax=Acinetobacter soli TaxID=487316 RepID=UPI003BA0F454
MKNYKIRVNNEAESREAQELFFELGYAWHSGKHYLKLDSGCTHLTVYSDGALTMGSGDAKEELTLPQLRDLVAQSKSKEQGLISGADAKIAWANGGHVQFRDEFDKWYQDWTDLEGKKNGFWITDFDLPNHQFRLKPRTVKLEIEVPAPFEPKEDCTVFILDDGKTNGYRTYSYEIDGDEGNTFMGMWRTEDEIKIVVEQLRKLKEHSK